MKILKNCQDVTQEELAKLKPDIEYLNLIPARILAGRPIARGLILHPSRLRSGGLADGLLASQGQIDRPRLSYLYLHSGGPPTPKRSMNPRLERGRVSMYTMTIRRRSAW